MTAMTRRPIVLVFAGQGAQHARMAAGLYHHDDVFTYWMDEAFRLYRNGATLRKLWLDPIPPAEFDEAQIAQPLLYAVNHALGRMVLDRGVDPIALLGHSVGEFAAATLAGVLSFDDGVRLMQVRMQRFSEAPSGSMIAVAASLQQVEELLEAGEVYLAAVNGPRQLLLSGRREALDAAISWLGKRQVTCRDLACGTAFHSPVLDAAVTATLASFRSVRFLPPTIPMYSAYTQAPLDDGHAVDPYFWAWQAAQTVYFGPTLSLVLKHRDCLVLEAGPGSSLSMLACRQSRVRNGFSQTRSLLPNRSSGDEADRLSVREVFDSIGLPPLTIPARV